MSEASAPAVKPGFKTSEFLMTILWILAAGTGLILPFFLDGDHTAVQIASAVAGMIKAAGYDWSRTTAKSDAVKAAVVSGSALPVEPEKK